MRRTAPFVAAVIAGLFVTACAVAEGAWQLHRLGDERQAAGVLQLPAQLPAQYRLPRPRLSLEKLPRTLGPPLFTGTQRYEAPRHNTTHAERRRRERAGVPGDFDWQAYLDYNIDAPGSSRAEAEAHYVAVGARQGRLYRRLPLILHYSHAPDCGDRGLMNQQYSHLAALSLGLLLGADVCVPPGRLRSGHNGAARDLWLGVPLESVWDPAYITHSLAAHGIVLMEQPQPYVERASHVAYGQHLAERDPAYTVALPKLESPKFDIREDFGSRNSSTNLLRNITRAVVQRAMDNLRAGRNLSRPLVLEVQCPFFALKSARLPEMSFAARVFRFAPFLQQLADTVLARMLAAELSIASGGAGRSRVPLFNGLHLRVESDQPWAPIFGGIDEFWLSHLRACRAANFTRQIPLYVGSTVLSEPAKLAKVRAWATRGGISSRLYHKEMFLSAAVLGSLHAEQRRVVDFLVLIMSRRFVGLAFSTFSLYVREYRHVMGLAPREASRLVVPVEQEGRWLLPANQTEPYEDTTTLP